MFWKLVTGLELVYASYHPGSVANQILAGEQLKTSYLIPNIAIGLTPCQELNISFSWFSTHQISVSISTLALALA